MTEADDSVTQRYTLRQSSREFDDMLAEAIIEQLVR